jgi:hypothetical protein
MSVGIYAFAFALEDVRTYGKPEVRTYYKRARCRALRRRRASELRETLRNLPNENLMAVEFDGRILLVEDDTHIPRGTWVCPD